MANPLLSLFDDALSFLTAAVAIVLLLLLLPLLAGMLWVAGWAAAKPLSWARREQWSFRL